MNLFHFRYRNRLGLLAASALPRAEAEWVMKHVADCDPCAGELRDLEQTTRALAREGAFDRPLPISSEALRTRVFAQIRAEARPRSLKSGWSVQTAVSAMGLVGIGLVAGVLTARLGVAPPDRTAPEAVALEASADKAQNDADFYERLEKTHVRANAARYLAEAQDILIQVTAAADCPDSPKDSVDVTREAQTSRTLLRRRAALVSGSGETLMAARGVMEEVEGLLQQVADLPQCTRRTDVDAIARKVDRRNLLMKIDLVSQELAAP